jgi:pSer/pThr/pTyr-binding forkhead associated (FHA) protein
MSASNQIVDLTLEVSSGPMRGQRIPVVVTEFFIGRDPGCQFRVNEGTVSRRHCVLTVGTSDVRIKDLGSRNGTRLNGHVIQGEVPLRSGDTISVGSVLFRFEAPPTWHVGMRLPSAVNSALADTVDDETHLSLPRTSPAKH